MARYKVKIHPNFWKSAEQLKLQYNSEYAEIIADIKESIQILASGQNLPAGYNDHLLVYSPYMGFREYHIRDDILVVYTKNNRKLTLRFVEIVSHQGLKNFE